MGKKKAQASLFIILGIVIVSVITMAYLTNNQNDGLEKFGDSESGFSDAEIEEYVGMCLEETSLEGLKKVGFNEEIGAYIEQNIGECIAGFEYFKDTGYEFVEGVPKAIVEADSDYLLIDLDYPLRISKDNKVTELTVFHYSLKNIETLNADSGVFSENDLIMSPDKRMVLRFDKDTRAFDKENQPVEQVSLKALDRQYGGMENSVVIGGLIYEGGPDGTVFDKPVDITIQLDEIDSRASA